MHMGKNGYTAGSHLFYRTCFHRIFCSCRSHLTLVKCDIGLYINIEVVRTRLHYLESAESIDRTRHCKAL
ncbi:hypothetical protein GQ44DRAFT_717203 [Phaeosphaeriaceae sp. PMI808]|nr:hypothetical protein GQ44DRAFT_717203 [Phaeosphaeriaceae sp. PMI808]